MLTLVLVVFVIAVATGVPDLKTVLQLKGTAFGLPMVYIYPPVIFLSLGVPCTLPQTAQVWRDIFVRGIVQLGV